jgi:hypothetical protein
MFLSIKFLLFINVYKEIYRCETLKDLQGEFGVIVIENGSYLIELINLMGYQLLKLNFMIST